MTYQLANDAAAAIHLEIQQKKYNRALLLLEAINGKIENNDWVNWQSALMAARVGNLPLARSYANELPEDFSPAVKKLQAAIENQMKPFETFITRYNEAVSLIKAGQPEAALQMLNEAMEEAGKMPLLPEVYKTKLLLMWKLNHPRLAKFAFDLPVYAMDQKAVQDISKLMETAEPHAQQPDIQPRKKTRKPLLFLTATAVVLLASAALLTWQNGDLLQSAVPENSAGEQISAGNTTAHAGAPIEDEDVEDGNENITPEPDNAAASEEKSEAGAQSSVEETETGADTLQASETPIPEAVAKAYYKAGFDSYKAGNFSSAAAYLDMVLAADEISYFTDDAAYYLAISYLKENEFDKAIDLAAEFSRSESVHFMESPYKDAILLQKGTALYHAGQEKEAIELLTNLASDPSLGWVKGEADKTLKLVVEHGKHD